MEKQAVSKSEYEVWVKRMCHEFNESGAKVFREGSYTYIYKGSKVSSSKRCSADDDNPDVGIAYAWARLTNQTEYRPIETITLVPRPTQMRKHIDDLGRICIPRVIRRNLCLKEGDSMIFYTADDAIIIKKA